MRKPAGLLALVLVTTGFAAAAVSAEPAGRAASAPPETPVAHYTLDEGTGPIAHDTSGNGHDGTLVGGTTWSAGVYDTGALDFNGGNGYVRVDGAVVDTTASYTVAAWVRTDTLNGYRTAVSIDGTGVSAFYLQLRGDTQRWAFTTQVRDATAADPQRSQVNGTGGTATGQWYHLTGVYDATAKRITLYVNGLRQESTAFTPTWRANGPTVIGRALWGGLVDYFDGRIDDVRFYAEALPATSVAKLATGAHYAFEEGSGTTAADETGNAPAGTLSGGATWTDGLVGDSAVAFDGGQAMIDVPAPIVDSTSSFSVSAWVRLDRISGTQIVAAGEPGGAFALRVRDGRFEFARAPDTTATAGEPARAGEWYHLVGVSDASSGRATLYVNGAAAATAASTDAAKATRLTIGRGLAGAVDDVRVYQFVLGSTEVLNLSAAGSWSLEDGAGATAADDSPNGTTGTLRGDATWVRSASSTGLSLAAGADLTMGDAAALDFGDRSFSVGGWFDRTAGTGGQTLLAKGYRLSVADRPGHVEFSVSRVTVGTTAAFPAREWHHAVAIVDRAAGTIRLQVDGTAQAVRVVGGLCAKARGTFADIKACSGLSASSDRAFTVGSADGRGFLTGGVDEIRAYPYALTGQQAAGLANFNTVRIDASRPGPRIPESLWGAFFEEINYAGVGGLYAELLRNRSFMESATTPVWWNSLSGTAALDPQQPLNAKLTRSLRLSVPGSVANNGYFGVPVRGGERLSLSLWAKAAEGFDGRLGVRLEKADGSAVLVSAHLRSPTGDWRRLKVSLRVPKNVTASTDNRLVIFTEGGPSDAPVWLSTVSLFPPTYKDRPNGLRIDLAKKLAGMNPAFLRFPGGNYLEGGVPANRFDWKQTIGPIWERPGHLNDAWGYWSDDGLGLLEYLQLCEDLGAEPVIGVYAGYNLNGTHVPIEQLGPYVQDTLDEIEYITGPVTSEWGARRARDGHPKPFTLRYVEIGNEDIFDPAQTYDQRYAAFHDAIKAEHPELQLIATTPVQSRTPDVIDEHFYNSPAFFAGQAHRYDSYSRSGPKIFVGEYAVTQGSPTGILAGAIGEAAFMTGMERNADVVSLAAYAPLFVNVHGQQWSTNLIGYDALDSYKSPSYYVQSLFARNTGSVGWPTEVAAAGGNALYSVTSRDERTGTVYVKVVNPSNAVQFGSLTFAGASMTSRGSAIVLGGKEPNAQNTLENPRNVAPRTESVDGVKATYQQSFEPQSLTIFRLRTR
ncbi:LamG-like jellyroll fold domain-containing protein [Flindersiella endophytica]